MIKLGDMAVLCEPGALPAKVWKALAVVAAELHPAYDKVSGLPPGKSKELCLFTSLAVRDFLVQIGFRDATVRGCALYVYADDLKGKQIWSVGIGVPDQEPIEGKFNGHAVCTIPSLNLLIDTTIYQAQRPQYFGDLPGMMAAQYYAPQHAGLMKLYRLPIFANAVARDEVRELNVIWLDRPDLPWKKSEDFRVRNNRRIAVTKAMLAAFGEFKEGDQANG
jgi:hypothetical protein